MKKALLALLAPLVLAACFAPEPPVFQMGSDGKPLPRVYRITEADKPQIQFRMLDAINVLRQTKGLPPMALDARLTAAAATHARDIARQNRPWHFGSDGSSPIDRVRRVGYTGHLVGETLSETYETELETLAAWMAEPATRDIILDDQASEMGFSWFQEGTHKLWWVLTIGAETSAPESALDVLNPTDVLGDPALDPNAGTIPLDPEAAALEAMVNSVLR